MPSIKVEETKQVVKEFYKNQKKLMQLMLELSDEEFKEFDPWFTSITNENFKTKTKILSSA